MTSPAERLILPDQATFPDLFANAAQIVRSVTGERWPSLGEMTNNAPEQDYNTAILCAGGLVIAEALKWDMMPDHVERDDAADFNEDGYVITAIYRARDARATTEIGTPRVTDLVVATLARLRNSIEVSYPDALPAAQNAWRAAGWYSQYKVSSSTKPLAYRETRRAIQAQRERWGRR